MKKLNLINRKLTKRYFWLMPGPTKGQAIVEYTVLFAVVAVVTAIATAAFFTRIARSDNGSSAFERYSNAVQQRIINH